ncbi:BaiN/RdsA family NAD(P)/FAD-dependent oxidoreductase [Elizabethkingia anophelis]|uniref:NAD(P)/FAD-dependent oxidoreductase n=1 Tax=Elizabethkingia anophelis TaxID=1117645 RepID=UPI0009951AFD|nr:NAD(P)/FAD-dependent oxidoreductase [Elizabethkingia anophelis]MYY27032.1 NAD(P)/FAD-dependent oxidoreductase [Elizabethkingia anophelis]MYY49458.1 NAD(P)/FAD-dependent oxidoreductase [Elizabethkingia anophelis]
MNLEKKKLVIIGGGAAGFFTAANVNGEKYDIHILEQASDVLQKVKISGGGRCNVTHACFDPRELTSFYPRGNKELLSVFTKFQPGDTMGWFEERGVALKIEDDNRIFPESNSSLSIMNALADAVIANGTKVSTKQVVKKIEQQGEQWIITTSSEEFTADIVVFCTGSSPKSYQLLKPLNFKIVDLVPSLFTFNIKNKSIEGLMGTSFPNAWVKLPALKKEESGPLLITHWGLSGPAVLKLSAWCARELLAMDYNFDVNVNFLGIDISIAEDTLSQFKADNPKKSIGQSKVFDITNRFWNHLLDINNIDPQKQLGNISNKEVQLILESLCQNKMQVKGKSTFKDEFVTAGGVDLKEIDFKTMQSKKYPNFYLAGEVLNIDAITGGFNFQACWSEAWLIAQDLNAK